MNIIKKILSAAMIFTFIALNMSGFAYAETASERVKKWRESFSGNSFTAEQIAEIEELGTFVKIRTEIVYSIEDEEGETPITRVYGVKDNVEKYNIRKFPVDKELYVHIRIIPYMTNLKKNVAYRIWEWVTGADRYDYLKELSIPVEISIDKSRKISVLYNGGLGRDIIGKPIEDISGKKTYSFDIKNDPDNNWVVELRFIPVAPKNGKSEANLEIKYGTDEQHYIDKSQPVYQNIIFKGKK
ncbi:MAG: hypothetical protein K5838_04610 [Elusimicrobiales bacterium]|nr:hypothetical protein [Elusimicrobiales bacterium]